MTKSPPFKPLPADTGDGRVRMAMSAFLDGELSAAESEVLFSVLAERSDLAREFEQMAALFSGGVDDVLRSTALHADTSEIAEAVMAAVDGNSAPESDAVALRLLSKAADETISVDEKSSLVSRLRAAPRLVQARDFLAINDGVAAILRSPAIDPPSFDSLLSNVFAAVDDEVSALERLSRARDERLSASARTEIVEYLSHGPRAADRQAHAQQFLAATSVLGMWLRAPEHAPEAKRAGSAALQAIGVVATNEAKRSFPAAREERIRQRILTNPVGQAPSAPSRTWQNWLFGVPALLGATALVFLAVYGDPEKTALAPDKPQFLASVTTDLEREEQAEQARLAAIFDKRLIDEQAFGSANVEEIDSLADATFVYQTAASHLTVIWIQSAPSDDSETQGG